MVEETRYGKRKRHAVDGIRPIIADRLGSAQRDFILVNQDAQIEATVLDQVRRERGMSYLPLIMKAVSSSLHDHPAFNSRFLSRENAGKGKERREYLFHDYTNIGYAVDTRKGLMVPNVKNVEGKSIDEIAKEMTEVTKQLRETGNTSIDNLMEGTFTISSVGSLGKEHLCVTYASAIPNYPETAILAIGRAYQGALPVSLTFDHGLVDGADAVRFLGSVASYLNDPDFLRHS